MIILHAAAIDDGQLFVWGEAPINSSSGEESGEQPVALTARPASRSKPVRSGASGLRAVTASVEKPLISPFDAGARLFSALSAALTREDDDSSARILTSFNKHEAVLSLPSRSDGKPCASSPLLEDTAELAMVDSRRWRCSGYRLTMSQFVGLLTRLDARRKILAHGLSAGEDVIFWSRLMDFAAGLTVRHKFLPGISRRAEGWYALWEPVIAGDDLERLMQMSSAAPGAIFAAVESADNPQPLHLVHRYVSAMLDEFVRTGAARSRVQTCATGKKTAVLAAQNLHDLWLQALGSSNPKLDAPAEGIIQLQSDLARWKRPLNATVNAPFRLCFRLEEPEPLPDYHEYDNVVALRFAEDLALDERPWRINYLLQSAMDPSLFIEANAVWSDNPDSPIIERTAFGAREYLLASLGAASMIYPPVEASLLNAKPSLVEIDVNEAYRFLSEKANLLHEAGFGVMLPSWWTQPSGRQRLKATARIKDSKLKASDGKLNADALLSFQWDMALGGQPISREELEELAKLKVPLIRLRGQWIEIDSEQLKAAIKFLKTNKQTVTLRELLRLDLGAIQLPENIDFDGITGVGWAADFLDKFTHEARYEQLNQPEGFSGLLRPYQQRGYSWMHFVTKWGLGGCLADDMGLGKTVQTLALIAQYWNETAVSVRRPTLLICPMSVVGNWQRECERFTPDLPIFIHHGAGRARGQKFLQEAVAHAIVVSSYSLLARDIELFKEVNWSGVIVDEAQTIKNAGTQQAKAAHSIKADFKLALTGTPVENNVGDLWSIMEFLNPGLLGTQSQFKKSFLTPIQVDRDDTAIAKLKKIVSPFILRRLKTDRNIIKDLPEKVEMKVLCNLTREQASLYSAVLKEMETAIRSADGIGRKGLVLATMSKLKQVCNHPAQFLHDNSIVSGRSGKLQRLVEMLDESLQGGDSALIFTQFAEMGEMLKQYLQDEFAEEVLFLHGAITQQRREQMVQRFQDGNGPRLFVLSLKAGGVGLNLTRANQVFHFDRWWNPAVENQATDRAFRIGQSKNVHVHKFVCIGTLEEKIDQMIEAKQELAGNIVGTGENWLTELNNEQLRDLFALSKDAVSD